MDPWQPLQQQNQQDRQGSGHQPRRAKQSKLEAYFAPPREGQQQRQPAETFVNHKQQHHYMHHQQEEQLHYHQQRPQQQSHAQGRLQQHPGPPATPTQFNFSVTEIAGVRCIVTAHPFCCFAPNGTPLLVCAPVPTSLEETRHEIATVMQSQSAPSQPAGDGPDSSGGGGDSREPGSNSGGGGAYGGIRQSARVSGLSVASSPAATAVQAQAASGRGWGLAAATGGGTNNGCSGRGRGRRQLISTGFSGASGPCAPNTSATNALTESFAATAVSTPDATTASASAAQGAPNQSSAGSTVVDAGLGPAELASDPHSHAASAPAASVAASASARVEARHRLYYVASFLANDVGLYATAVPRGGGGVGAHGPRLPVSHPEVRHALLAVCGVLVAEAGAVGERGRRRAAERHWAALAALVPAGLVPPTPAEWAAAMGLPPPAVPPDLRPSQPEQPPPRPLTQKLQQLMQQQPPKDMQQQQQEQRTEAQLQPQKPLAPEQQPLQPPSQSLQRPQAQPDEQDEPRKPGAEEAQLQGQEKSYIARWDTQQRLQRQREGKGFRGLESDDPAAKRTRTDTLGATSAACVDTPVSATVPADVNAARPTAAPLFQRFAADAVVSTASTVAVAVVAAAASSAAPEPAACAVASVPACFAADADAVHVHLGGRVNPVKIAASADPVDAPIGSAADASTAACAAAATDRYSSAAATSSTVVAAAAAAAGHAGSSSNFVASAGAAVDAEADDAGATAKCIADAIVDAMTEAEAETEDEVCPAAAATAAAVAGTMAPGTAGSKPQAAGGPQAAATVHGPYSLWSNRAVAVGSKAAVEAVGRHGAAAAPSAVVAPAAVADGVTDAGGRGGAWYDSEDDMDLPTASQIDALVAQYG